MLGYFYLTKTGWDYPLYPIEFKWSAFYYLYSTPSHFLIGNYILAIGDKFLNNFFFILISLFEDEWTNYFPFEFF